MHIKFTIKDAIDVFKRMTFDLGSPEALERCAKEVRDIAFDQFAIAEQKYHVNNAFCRLLDFLPEITPNSTLAVVVQIDKDTILFVRTKTGYKRMLFTMVNDDLTFLAEYTYDNGDGVCMETVILDTLVNIQSMVDITTGENISVRYVFDGIKIRRATDDDYARLAAAERMSQHDLNALDPIIEQNMDEYRLVDKEKEKKMTEWAVKMADKVVGKLNELASDGNVGLMSTYANIKKNPDITRLAFKLNAKLLIQLYCASLYTRPWCFSMNALTDDYGMDIDMHNVEIPVFEVPADSAPYAEIRETLCDVFMKIGRNIPDLVDVPSPIITLVKG